MEQCTCRTPDHLIVNLGFGNMYMFVPLGKKLNRNLNNLQPDYFFTQAVINVKPLDQYKKQNNTIQNKTKQGKTAQSKTRQNTK